MSTAAFPGSPGSHGSPGHAAAPLGGAAPVDAAAVAPGTAAAETAGSPEHEAVYLPGPWRHREIVAGNTRFHAVEAGHGPLVVLLHGFGGFWWSWAAQIPALAAAGLRVVAPDLRGYGGSDKPPRGYDLPGLADDVASMIRALGEPEAMVAGHDWGGAVAWTLGVTHRRLVSKLAVLAAPHPLALRHAVVTNTGGQLLRSGHLAGVQLPRAEHLLGRNDGALLGRWLHSGGAPDWPPPDVEATLRRAFCLPRVAHCALEWQRWAVRSQFRPDGLRYSRTMRAPLTAPVLALHGALDRMVPPAVAAQSAGRVRAPYRWELLPAAGHFLQQECPEQVNALLTAFLTQPPGLGR